MGPAPLRAEHLLRQGALGKQLLQLLLGLPLLLELAVPLLQLPALLGQLRLHLRQLGGLCPEGVLLKGHLLLLHAQLSLPALGLGILRANCLPQGRLELAARVDGRLHLSLALPHRLVELAPDPRHLRRVLFPEPRGLRREVLGLLPLLPAVQLLQGGAVALQPLRLPLPARTLLGLLRLAAPEGGLAARESLHPGLQRFAALLHSTLVRGGVPRLVCLLSGEERHQVSVA
mmetsp:Transcript_56581/g.166122  ORF Transcript_56581/g.166122 Transcript_56581/m.166122 type:complete len:231 (+) Transcript_56581:548-1240(+)